jgi:biopolymer transport protein ExbD
MIQRRFSSPSQQAEEINLSPLIDMVFILLIFFIVTTVFVEETGIDVTKPEAASAVDLEKQSILIALTPSGEVVYGGRDIGVNGVRGTVQRLVQEAADMPVILQADKAVTTERLVRVIDEAKLGGALVVNIATAN